MDGSIVGYLDAMMTSKVNELANNETQQVLGNNQQFYTINTRRRGHDAVEMTMLQVNLLTPYAGDGYGMVCAPRTGQNMLVAPVRGKESAAVALGRIYTTNENIPAHNVGDFLIHHETHSELLFAFTQPIVEFDGTLRGMVLELADKEDGAKADSRTFTVSTDDKTISLQEGDTVSVILLNEMQNDSPEQRAGDVADPRLTWATKVVKGADQSLTVTVTSQQLSNGLDIADYSEPDIKQFKAFKILPDKGLVQLKHYTGSGLHMDEYPDYVFFDNSDDDATEENIVVVRHNVNAVIGDVIRTEKDGEKVQVSKHRAKGMMSLLNYNQSGLLARETQIQYRAGATQLLMQLQKDSPLSDVSGERIDPQTPELQFIMEDITQDERDVATRAVLRQLSSGTLTGMSKKNCFKYPELRFQAEDGHYGVDGTNVETIELEGSGFFVEDFLKQFDEDKEGWKFASRLDAKKQYKEFDDKFYEAMDSDLTSRSDEDGEYDIEYKKRIIPASGRRDVMLKVEGEDNKVPLLSSKLETLTDENKQFIGQKGYLYKTHDDKDVMEDGYLCNPKGRVAFTHYTRSGIDIRELDPDIDFHGIQASFNLYGWDLGQYSILHEYSKNRDSAEMTFGPYPLPLAGFVMESAKIDYGKVANNAAIPTLPVAHTQYPQKSLKDDDHSGRTTLTTYGETATWVGIEQFSSHIQQVSGNFDDFLGDTNSETSMTEGLAEGRFGSRLLFKDYVIHATPDDDKTPLIAAAKWQNKRGETHKLLAPKGSVELHHYTGSGLAFYDKKQHYISKFGGGHSMAMRLSLRSFNFIEMKDNEAVNPYANDDGYFFCEMLSNEVVDKEPYTFSLDENAFDEEGSPRGKAPSEAHGKRAATTGFAHGTTRTEKWEIDPKFYIEDYVIPQESDAGIDYFPSHIYKPKEGKEPRKLLMPKGEGGITFWNYSQVKFGDWEKQNEEGIDPEDVARGKKQRPYTYLELNAWNNQKIDSPDECPAQPYVEPSAALEMSCTANMANYNGKDAVTLVLETHSNKVESESHGCALLFEDYVDYSGDEGESCHIYDDSDDASKRKPLLMPKGSLTLQHYTKSGLFIWDADIKDKDSHKPYMELRLTPWDEDKPKAEPVAIFFAQDQTTPKTEEAVKMGLVHVDTVTGLKVVDTLNEKDKHQMITSLHHRGEEESYLTFTDKDDEGTDVKVELRHKAGDYLQIESNNETEVLLKLNHHTDMGIKFFNTGGNNLAELYHPSGAAVTILNDGTIQLKPVTQVLVDGDLHVAGTITSPGGEWHMP